MGNIPPISHDPSTSGLARHVLLVVIAEAFEAKGSLSLCSVAKASHMEKPKVKAGGAGK